MFREIAEKYGRGLFEFESTDVRDFVAASLFIFVLSQLENYLYLLCMRLRDVEGFKRKPSDLKHRGITRYVTYLKKVAGVDNIRTDQGPYQDIRKRQDIRNKIVHDLYAHVEEDHQQDRHLRALIRKMDKAYLFETIDLVQGFLASIFDEIDHKYPGALAFEEEDQDYPNN